MPFVKVTKKQKNDMLRSGGYRERDIVSKARFAVKGNKGRTVTFYKPHTRHGKYGITNENYIYGNNYDDRHYYWGCRSLFRR